MNWRAGLFRIWVVVAVVWMAACAVFGFWVWRNSENVTYTLTNPSGLKFTVQAPKGTSESEVAYFVRNLDAVKKRQAECARDRGPWCDEAMAVEMTNDRSWVLTLIAVMAIGGPLVVFLLGLVCFWVASGFQRPPSSQKL